MLEADFSDPLPQITINKGVALPPVSQAVEPVTPVYSRGAGKLVTYSVFLESCWPHFSETLRKGLGMWLNFILLSQLILFGRSFTGIQGMGGAAIMIPLSSSSR